ncbi:hypothetical protein [Rufibacter sp. XAAS-G3-1]|uniref:hypothetical protein n=1 Tax=Rufibacter sp. XAAS-G3-1 TaxID=2729134 RepID=UPI0015E6E45E|nr:hypothetical protein [Rufibacter sp. XAAS-G3-1]
MKVIKRFFDASLIVIVIVNILTLVLTLPYGGITRGIYFSVLTDRPEFSHLNYSILVSINIVSTILVILGTILPLVVVFIKTSMKRKLIICLALIPILFLIVRILAFPEPDSFKQTSMGEYQIKTYEWKTRHGRKVKSWKSEKPYSAYKHNERIKWILIENNIKHLIK